MSLYEKAEKMMDAAASKLSLKVSAEDGFRLFRTSEGDQMFCSVLDAKGGRQRVFIPLRDAEKQPAWEYVFKPYTGLWMP